MLVDTCDLCAGVGCLECQFMGWVYLFRRKDGTILRGVNAWLRSRSSTSREITKQRFVKPRNALLARVVVKVADTSVGTAEEGRGLSTISSMII